MKLPKDFSSLRVAGMVFLLAVLLRVGLWAAYGPISYSDTASYRRLADQILQGWVSYDGSRVPGYPVFLALVGLDDRVYLVQLLMGIGVTMCFFYMGWRITRNPWFGALAAMLHQFNLGQLFFEANLLSETLATFLVVVSFTGVIHGIYVSGARKWWLAFLIGLLTAIAILTRPLFIFLPPWFLIWILIGWQDSSRLELGKSSLLEILRKTWQLTLDSLRRNWVLVVTFTLPVVGLIAVWVGFIRYYYGDWALSTMTGYHLVQHTGAFFEYVPDEYAAIRDTYLRFRQERIAAYGTQTNTIWEAIPEMQQASGLNFYDLSRTLSKISIQLIREHPFLFFRSVAGGWWLFWRAPVYWSASGFQASFWNASPVIAVLKALIVVQRFFLFGANILFLVYPFLLGLKMRLSVGHQAVTDVKVKYSWVVLLGAVWLTSIVQSLLDHGDNPRFLVPLQSIIMMWVIWWAITDLPVWIRFFRLKSQGGVPE